MKIPSLTAFILPSDPNPPWLTLCSPLCLHVYWNSWEGEATTPFPASSTCKLLFFSEETLVRSLQLRLRLARKTLQLVLLFFSLCFVCLTVWQFWSPLYWKSYTHSCQQGLSHLCRVKPMPLICTHSVDAFKNAAISFSLHSEIVFRPLLWPEGPELSCLRPGTLGRCLSSLPSLGLAGSDLLVIPAVCTAVAGCLHRTPLSLPHLQLWHSICIMMYRQRKKKLFLINISVLLLSPGYDLHTASHQGESAPTLSMARAACDSGCDRGHFPGEVHNWLTQLNRAVCTAEQSLDWGGTAESVREHVCNFLLGKMSGRLYGRKAESTNDPMPEVLSLLPSLQQGNLEPR